MRDMRDTFLAEMHMEFHLAARQARWDRQVPAAPRMRRQVETEVRRLHSRPRGLPDETLFPPNVVGNPWPYWRTVAGPTVGNYYMSRRWWRDMWSTMRRAFDAEVAEATGRMEPDWAERRRQVGVITNLVA